jgi:hypothetical protein
MNASQPQYGQLGQPTAPGAQPPKNKGKGGKVALGILGSLVVLGAFGAALDSGDSAESKTAATYVAAGPSTTAERGTFVPQTPAWTAPAAAPVAPKAVPAPAPKTSWTNGTYRVGKDIPVGEYQYVVDKKANGYWATCQDTACEVMGGMISNDWIPTAGATGYLTLGEEVSYVELKGLTLTPAN